MNAYEFDGKVYKVDAKGEVRPGVTVGNINGELHWWTTELGPMESCISVKDARESPWNYGLDGDEDAEEFLDACEAM